MKITYTTPDGKEHIHREPMHFGMGGRRHPDGTIEWTECSIIGGDFTALQPVKPTTWSGKPRTLKYSPTAHLPWKNDDRT